MSAVRSCSRLAPRRQLISASRAVPQASRALATRAGMPLLMASSTVKASFTKASPLLVQRSTYSQWVAPTITYEQLKPLTIQPPIDTYLIDVREPDEVALGSIPSSVNIPLSALPGAFHLPPDKFRQSYGFEKPTKDQQLIFYCRSGKRSATATEHAKQYGFSNIKNYVGSWLDWAGREGKKVE